MNKNEKITKEIYKEIYWEHFINLEKELLSTRQYVELDKNNYATFSFKYLQLFQVVCSEIDVISKALLSHINNKKFDGNFNKYNFFLQNRYQDIVFQEIIICDNLQFQPYKNYEMVEKKEKGKVKHIQKYPHKKKDKWWKYYNDVKHARTFFYNEQRINYTKANLKNLLFAFCALFLLEKCFAKELECEEIITTSKIFKFVVTNNIKLKSGGE